jgi:hypothetical protein
MFERRGGPRIDVNGRATVGFPGFKGHITLMNVSPGGFGITTTHILPSDDALEFGFSAADGSWAMTFKARLAYIRIQPGSKNGDAVYLAGLAFVEADAPQVRTRIDDLLEKIAGVNV